MPFAHHVDNPIDTRSVQSYHSNLSIVVPSRLKILIAILVTLTQGSHVTSFMTSHVRQGSRSPTKFPTNCDHLRHYKLNMWSNNENIEGSDRIKSCVPYLLPLLDGDHFGMYIYDRIPPLGLVDDYLLGPLLNFYHSIPFSPILFFLAITLGTRGNMSMNRAVRFNAQQAAIIDVVLVFPELIAASMEDSNLPRSLLEPCSNFVYYLYMSMVVYSVSSNLRGLKPNRIPLVSEAAEMAVGPF